MFKRLTNIYQDFAEEEDEFMPEGKRENQGLSGEDDDDQTEEGLRAKINKIIENEKDAKMVSLSQYQFKGMHHCLLCPDAYINDDQGLSQHLESKKHKNREKKYEHYQKKLENLKKIKSVWKRSRPKSSLTRLRILEVDAQKQQFDPQV
mmetsp:Transcript_57681/g.65828  ORF Transcript_57681/g.65828 Transcript_57681/m.65828 type:complete len:149 (-) Transcript_57681:280-726(-)